MMCLIVVSPPTPRDPESVSGGKVEREWMDVVILGNYDLSIV